MTGTAPNVVPEVIATERSHEMSITRKIAGALAGLSIAALLAGCSTAPGTEGSAETTVKLGVVGAAEEFWTTFTEAAKDEGITVELVDFQKYDLPNPALSAGDIDISQFQHIIYLAQYNEAAGEDLAIAGSTATYPLGLYSKKYDSPEEIPEGSVVGIPNDESNQARALLGLEKSGLITITGGGTILSTPADIDEANSKVSVKAVEGSLTATLLDDPGVAAVAINNDFVTKAGVDQKTAIAKDSAEDPKSQAYVNVFAVRAEDRDNPTYQKLVEIYQNNAEVQAGVQKSNNNTAVFAKIPVEDLAETLAEVQKNIADAK